jgi:putative SOS response-associated peptidase YedK
MEQIHNKKKRMPTILTKTQAAEWVTPNLSEHKIMELATSAIDANQLSAYTIHKNFRTDTNPLQSFEYEELPQLNSI